jgi:hypothetical protein
MGISIKLHIVINNGLSRSKCSFETVVEVCQYNRGRHDVLEQLFWGFPHCRRNIKRGNKKTFEVVGDGTTLTCVLSSSVLQKTHQRIKKELHLLK